MKRVVIGAAIGALGLLALQYTIPVGMAGPVLYAAGAGRAVHDHDWWREHRDEQHDDGGCDD